MHGEAVLMRGGTPLGLSKHGMVFKPRTVSPCWGLGLPNRSYHARGGDEEGPSVGTPAAVIFVGGFPENRSPLFIGRVLTSNTDLATVEVDRGIPSLS